MMGDALVTTICMRCRAEVPVHDGFLSWCECGWRVDDAAPNGGSWWARRRRAGAERRGAAVVDHVVRTGAQRPRTAPLRTALLVVLSLPVWVIFVGCLALALRFAWSVPGAPLMAVPALLMVLIAWQFRLRLGTMPAGAATRDDLPAVFSVIDALNSVVEGSPIDRVVITPDFGAGISVVGWRQRRVLHLGAGYVAVTPARDVAAAIATSWAMAATATRSACGSSVPRPSRWQRSRRPWPTSARRPAAATRSPSSPSRSSSGASSSSRSDCC